ncbi:MAG: acetoacetate--CoA ligase [Planctomycetota bacterium]|nr:MAG: acetoacetate--CoA ligase [Planctomycetota bacterium]
MDEILWRPTEELRQDSLLASYLRFLPELGGPRTADYADLWAWSIRERAAFWASVWDFCGVIGERGGTVLENGEAMPGSRWFPEARLNFAENLLAGAAAGPGPALVFRGEDGRRRELGGAELAELTARLAARLRAWGIRPGDRVAAVLPNSVEAVIGMLAASSLGAVWSSCSPDFGAAGVLDRFGQIEPKVLIACDGYSYKGRRLDIRDKLERIRAGLPGLEQTLLVPFADPAAELAGAVRWPDALGDGPAPSLDFERLPFDHPLYVMFSSGTTGKPKCIVHGQGGTLLQHLKEHQLHSDLRPGDRVFYFTTTGWMMWNWLVSALASRATVLLFDGNPFHPGPEALWDFVAGERATFFGTSAKYLDACKKAGLEPARSHDLGALRTIASTGSPLVPESFDWVYAAVKPEVQLASISGGTDLISCFALGCPLLPVRRGELQCRGLGMAVEVWSPDGRPLIGEPGELVCTRSFPSMPTGFWNDPDGSRYRAAYFEHFPGVWRHGDWAELRPSGGMVIYGRSDATLNPGGVRIGTAEIYRQVEQIEAVEEAIVVGQDTGDGDQRVVLFVRLAAGRELDDALEDEIRARIRANASPRHVPAVIARVTDIPRTRSGKISEIAVRDVIHGRPVANTEALANPEALEQYRNRPELALD